MDIIKSSKKFPFIIILLFLFFPTRVFAYLDPGSFSYLFSVLFAALVGILVYFKIFWIKIMSFIKKMFGKEKGKNK